MTSKTFFAWLRKQRQDDTPTGDLARDVARDSRPAPRNTKIAWLEFLNEGRASSIVIDAFERAWTDYELNKNEI